MSTPRIRLTLLLPVKIENDADAHSAPVLIVTASMFCTEFSCGGHKARLPLVDMDGHKDLLTQFKANNPHHC